jgi:CHAT domain-containing protein
MAHPEFPSDETLAAFIDGRADPETRKRVIEHMVGCNDCYATFEAASEMRERSEKQRVVAFPKRRLAVIGFAAAAVVVILLAPAIRDRLRPRSGLATLAAAAPAHRNIEGRLTGFPYRPMAPVMRGTDAENHENLKLLSVAAQIQEEADKNPTPENLHQLGVAYLLLGNSTKAVSTLEESLKRGTGEDIPAAIQKSTDASLLTDLSAGYLARGAVTQRTEDLLAAVESAERAYALSRSPEAAFNRAMAIEELHGIAQARSAWEDFLRIDRSSGWTDEAEKHIGQTKKSNSGRISIRGQLEATRLGHSKIPISTLVKEHRFETTKYAIEELLPRWARAFTSNDSATAGDTEQFAKSLAAEIGRSSDQFLTDCIVAIEHSKGDRRTLRQLAAGHEAYAEARRLYRGEDVRSAISLFDRARRFFHGAQSPAEILAWNYHASALIYADRYALARTDIDTALSRFSSFQDRYPAAVGQLYWTNGVVDMKSGLPQEALHSYERALTCFQRAGQPENVATVHSLLAESYEFVGDPAKAWVHRRFAIQTADRVPADRRYLILIDADKAAAASSFYYTASHFEEALVAGALETNDPFLIAEALTRRASGRKFVHDARATRDLKQAEVYASRVPDAVRRVRLSAEIDRAAADLESEANPRRAIELLGHAQRLYSDIDDHFRVAETHLERGKLEEQLGAAAAAEEDYRRGIDDVEHLRLDLSDSSTRAAYFARSADLFDRAIALTWRRGDPEGAFLLAERSRARALRDIQGGSRKDADVHRLTRELAKDTALIEYASVADKLLVWILKKDSFASRELPARAEECIRMTRQLAFAENDAAYVRTLAILYDALIRPIRTDLEGTTCLTFIPNKFLADIPFAALYDGELHAYLIERFQVGVLPSVALYRQGIQNESSRPILGTDVVVVSSAGGSDGSPRLGWVEPEISRISALYPRHATVHGDLTKRKLLETCARAEVVHFAGHAIQNELHPDYAYVLVPAGDGSTPLYAHEVIQHRFSRTRLVVLSACGTNVSTRANEAVPGIPESFLAAGVPTIVAAIRPVQDEFTSRMLYDFHVALRETGSASAALQSAQVHMVCEHQSPRDWSAWQVIGACHSAKRRPTCPS